MRSVPATLFVLLSLAATAGAQSPAARPDNYYGAGNRVEIATPMPADVIVAGRDVDIRSTIGGDIVAAGWHVTLAAAAEDDVRIAGSEVVVNAPISGDVTIAGGVVSLGPETHVGGRSWITGHSVRIDGVLEREVNIAAADVVIAGEVRQPIRIVAEALTVQPTARLLAPVTYRGPSEASIAQGATVIGPFTYNRVNTREARRAREMPALSTFLFTLHLFLAGLLVIVFVPRAEASIVETLRTQPFKSLLAGFTLLITVPIAALILIVSVLGLPLGVFLAGFYALALFAGVLTTAFFLGDAEARLLTPPAVHTRGQQAMVLLAGVLTLAVLRVILGGFAVFISMLFGLGALGVWLYQSYRRAHQPAAA
jgi:hypothetical protein